jgi:hypothetical protein
MLLALTAFRLEDLAGSGAADRISRALDHLE